MEEVQLQEINNIYDLLYVLVPILITMFLKWYSDNKKKGKTDDKLSEIDKKQSESIDILTQKFEKFEEDINFLKDSQKNDNFIKKLKLELSFSLENILDVKTLRCSELGFLFDASVFKLVEFAEIVVNRQFDINSIQLKKASYNLLKGLKLKIDRKKINGVSEPEDFLENIENNIIKPELENLIINFKSYSNMINGGRRTAFEVAILQLFSNIVNQTIDYHNAECRSK
jgi:hypothetical protein